MTQSKIAIFIPSCDNYADIWSLLAESYIRFWQDCPYRRYIITNSNIAPPEPFIPINVGVDTDWSSNCIKAIESIPEEFIMIHIDDLILTSRPQQGSIDRYICEWIEKDGNYLKLLDITRNTKENHIIPTDKTAPYRTSTVFSLWKKSVLLDILKAGESPWQLEVDGTTRSQKYDGWYSAPTDCFTFENLVIKRMIERRSLARLEKLGFHYMGNRQKMSVLQNSKYVLKCIIFEVILRLPKGMSKKLVELARKLG